MNRLIVLVAFVPLCLHAEVGVPCGSVPGNLVANCGFEAGDFTDWTLAVIPTFKTNPAGVAAGSFDGFTANSGNDFAYLGALGFDGTLTQTLATVPGDFYGITWYLGSDGWRRAG